MEKIRILNIITGGLKRDGISLSQLDYMRLINKEEFSIDIAAVYNNDESVIKEFEDVGCNIIRFPNRKKQLFKYIVELNRVMKKNNYDIVHVHGSSNLMSIELKLAKHNNIKVRIAHSRNTETNNLFLHKILQRMFDKSYNVALACGEDAGKWLFKDKNFIVLHNGKDLEKYKFDLEQRNIIRKKYNLENCVALGTVGNCNDQKNQGFLIDVFNDAYKKDNSLRLFIMGDGKNRIDLEKKVNDLGISHVVYFLGRIDNVNEVINGMDIMLLPSLFEGLPNVVLEWQANGIKSYISNKITNECKVCNLVEFLSIDNENDIWINSIINYSIIENEERNEQSKDARNKLIENGFEIKSNTQKLEKLYKELCLNNYKK